MFRDFVNLREPSWRLQRCGRFLLFIVVEGGERSFEGLAWGPEVKGGDFSGESASPEGEDSIGSFSKGEGLGLASVGEDELAVVKGDDSDGVRESEFVKGLEDGV